MIRLNNNEIAVRCLKCGSSVVTMSLVAVLKQLVPDLNDKSVYELSSRGPLIEFLRKNAGQLTFSEYFDDVPPGAIWNDIQCQDIERLTYCDCSFDICTSTEVFEHVPDDVKGFSEIFRVLKPNGLLICTIPLHTSFPTIERARRLASGQIEHSLPSEYHGDYIRGQCRVLAFRIYGMDILGKLRACGFSNAEILKPSGPLPWNYARPVIVAYKGKVSNSDSLLVSNSETSDFSQGQGNREPVTKQWD